MGMFNNVWTSFLFKNYGEDFRWVQGETPLTSLKFIFGVLLTYWSTLLIWAFLKGRREAYRLDYVSAMHNLFLCAWSALMFFWIVVDIYRVTYNGNASRVDFQPSFSLSVSQSNDKSRQDLNLMFFHMYIFYISKLYELFDTLILCMKGRIPIFLHWYHHSIAIIQVWLWLKYRLSFGSYGMTFNTVNTKVE
eukprot:CFRG5992T1